MSVGHLSTVLLLPLLVPAVEPDDPAPDVPWPEYRGPNGDGAAAEADVPLTWSENENVRWKTAIHGRGWSSPAVAEGRVWLTTATEDGGELSVLAVDLESGKVGLDRLLWRIAKPEMRNALNSYASPSPVVEAGAAYVHFGTYGTACIDAETGATRWQRRDIHCDHMQGPGSSPILWEDLLIFHMDGGDVQYVIALDKTNGETVWKTERSADLSPLNPDLRKAYSTPIVAEVGGKEQLISSGAQAVYGYVPRTGEELWTLRHKGFSMSARPLVGDGFVYVNSGFMRPNLHAVRLGGEGDVTDTHLEWTCTKGIPSMTSSVLVDGRIYTVSDGGVAVCIDAGSGRHLWRERLGTEYSASPVYAGGRVYYFDREGSSFAVAPKKTFELLGESELDSGCMASAAVAGDSFVLRTKTHLYRIEEPETERP